MKGKLFITLSNIFTGNNVVLRPHCERFIANFSTNIGYSKIPFYVEIPHSVEKIKFIIAFIDIVSFEFKCSFVKIA